jgi:hypothetical protein
MLFLPRPGQTIGLPRINILAQGLRGFWMVHNGGL